MKRRDTKMCAHTGKCHFTYWKGGLLSLECVSESGVVACGSPIKHTSKERCEYNKLIGGEVRLDNATWIWDGDLFVGRCVREH